MTRTADPLKVACKWLRVGLEFNRQEQLDTYLADHHKADPKNHWVTGEKPSGKSGDEEER